MGFKLYMEMDSQGKGAAISNAEFMIATGLPDSSCRKFKAWLIDQHFVCVTVRGRRGGRSEFQALIPGEGIPLPDSAIKETNSATQYRYSTPQIALSQSAIPELARPENNYARGDSNINNNNKNNQLASQEYDAKGALAGLNGAADLMLKDVMGWMPGGDPITARRWLNTTLHTYGQDVTRESYQKLVTDIASGMVIAQPLQTWSKIATRMKQEPKPAKAQETRHAQRQATLDRLADEQARQKKGLYRP